MEVSSVRLTNYNNTGDGYDNPGFADDRQSVEDNCNGRYSGDAEKENRQGNLELRSKEEEAAKDHERKPRKCGALRSWCYNLCRPCMAKHHHVDEDSSRGERVKHAFMCPPHGIIAMVIRSLVTFFLIWGTLWAITGDDALPGGNLFGLLVLVVCCLIGGTIVEKIRLPPLFGMLLIGVMLRNVPYIDVAKHINPKWSSAIRSLALGVLLIRAGLGLDPVALKRLSWVVLTLALFPGLVEAVAVAIPAVYILGMDWIWGFMLAFVLSAVSPAVVVPGMINLTERGLGVNKGIPTLAIASCSVNAVIAISAFGVLLGIPFATGDMAFTAIQGPVGVVIGLVYGLVGGILLWYIPAKKDENFEFWRTLLLFVGGVFVLFASKKVKFPGAGALGCLAIAFVAALRWRKEGWTDGKNPVAATMAKFWILFQPLLFGLIGAEIDLSKLDGATVGLSIAIIFIGLIPRMITSFVCVFKGTGFNLKEKFFMAIAWVPKASVQAAIGPVALDTARQYNAGPEAEKLGLQILTIAALSILITAPLGAAAIALSAPRLLHKTEKNEDPHIEENDEESAIDDKNDRNGKI